MRLRLIRAAACAAAIGRDISEERVAAWEREVAAGGLWPPRAWLLPGARGIVERKDTTGGLRPPKPQGRDFQAESASTRLRPPNNKVAASRRAARAASAAMGVRELDTDTMMSRHTPALV